MLTIACWRENERVWVVSNEINTLHNCHGGRFLHWHRLIDPISLINYSPYSCFPRLEGPKRELSGYRRAKNFINTSVRMCPTDKNFLRRIKIMNFMVLFQVQLESVGSLWLFGTCRNLTWKMSVKWSFPSSLKMRGVNWPIIMYSKTFFIYYAYWNCYTCLSKGCPGWIFMWKMRVSLFFYQKPAYYPWLLLIYLHVEFDKCENTKLRPAYPLKRSWVVDKPSLALPCIQES